MKEKISEEDFRDIDMGEYADDYSDDGLWDKIRDNVTSIGLTLIYKALQLYYTCIATTIHLPCKRYTLARKSITPAMQV